MQHLKHSWPFYRNHQ